MYDFAKKTSSTCRLSTSKIRRSLTRFVHIVRLRAYALSARTDRTHPGQWTRNILYLHSWHALHAVMSLYANRQHSAYVLLSYACYDRISSSMLNLHSFIGKADILKAYSRPAYWVCIWMHIYIVYKIFQNWCAFFVNYTAVPMNTRIFSLKPLYQVQRKTRQPNYPTSKQAVFIQ